MIDEEVRRLRYLFWRLPPFERLQVLMRQALIKPEDVDQIPMSFFKGAFDRALLEGGFDRLASDPWLKEKE
jgi:hypothetical protein